MIKVYFVIGHQMKGYEKEILDMRKEINKKFEVDAIIPKTISEEVKERLLDKGLNGVCISTESDEFGIYKSFNYEIFERRTSIVIAHDGIHLFLIWFKRLKMVRENPEYMLILLMRV